MNIYMICTLWTPFQAERDWKNLYREILFIALYILFSMCNIHVCWTGFPAIIQPGQLVRSGLEEWVACCWREQVMRETETGYERDWKWLKCPKNDKIYIFKKPLTMSFQICQNSCNNSNNSMCNQEKLECANFFWRAVCKQFAKKSLQNLCNPFPYVNGFQKDKNIKIRQLYVGQNKDLVCYWKE